MHRDHQRRLQRGQHLDHAFEVERRAAVDRHQHDIDAADLVELLLVERVMQMAEMRDAQVRDLEDEDRIAVALRAAAALVADVGRDRAHAHVLELEIMIGRLAVVLPAAQHEA